jgi:hypothetical protein
MEVELDFLSFAIPSQMSDTFRTQMGAFLLSDRFPIAEVILQELLSQRAKCHANRLKQGYYRLQSMRSIAFLVGICLI